MAASKEGDLGRGRWQGGRQQGRSSRQEQKMGIVVASEEEDLGREKMGDGSCRFGGAVISSLAAGEREYENGKLGMAGALLV